MLLNIVKSKSIFFMQGSLLLKFCQKQMRDLEDVKSWTLPFHITIASGLYNILYWVKAVW